MALLSRPRTEPVVQPVEPRLDHGSPAPQQGHVDVATSVHSAVRSCGPPDLRLPAQAIGIASVSSSPERNPSTWACTHFDAMSDGYVRDGNVTTGHPERAQPAKDLPAYSLARAGQIVRLPPSTLRLWARGAAFLSQPRRGFRACVDAQGTRRFDAEGAQGLEVHRRRVGCTSTARSYAFPHGWSRAVRAARRQAA